MRDLQNVESPLKGLDEWGRVCEDPLSRGTRQHRQRSLFNRPTRIRNRNSSETTKRKRATALRSFTGSITSTRPWSFVLGKKRSIYPTERG
jgi:hypothetical protein